jgi:hypothetical protein
MLQMIFVILFAIGGAICYARGTQPMGGPIAYPLFFVGAVVLFFTSVHLRRQHRWAWGVSMGFAALLVGLLIYRLLLGFVTLQQVLAFSGGIAFDVVLLFRGHAALRAREPHA